MGWIGHECIASLSLLQVALLSDQIEAQTDKITDLEKILDDKKDVLRKTEDVLQREMITRSSLETKKLELMSEISGLKLRQAAVERENIDLRKRLEMVMAANSQQPQQRQQQQQQHPMVDTIITLPPTGQQGHKCFWIPFMDKFNFLKTVLQAVMYQSITYGFGQQNHRYPTVGSHGHSNSANQTLQTFGTLPRRSRRSVEANNHQQSQVRKLLTN